MPWSLLMRCWRPQPRPLDSWLKSLRGSVASLQVSDDPRQHSEVERALREEVMVIAEGWSLPKPKKRSARFWRNASPILALPIVPVRNKTIRKPLIMEVLQAREMPVYAFPA